MTLVPTHYALSPDGKILFTGDDSTYIRITNLSTINAQADTADSVSYYNGVDLPALASLGTLSVNEGADGVIYGNLTCPDGSVVVFKVQFVPQTVNGVTTQVPVVSISINPHLFQNEVVTQNLTGVTLSAVSPNGRYEYAYSGTDHVLGIFDTKSNTWSSFFEGTQVPYGTLTGVTALVTSQDANGVQYVLLANANGTLATFSSTATDTTTNGTTTYSTSSVATSQTTNAAFAGVAAMSYAAGGSANTGTLYVLTGTTLTRYAGVADNLATLGTPTAMTTGTGLTGLRAGNGKLYVIGNGGSTVYAVALTGTQWLYSVTGLSAVTAVAVGGGDLYAASSGSRLYHLSDTGSGLVLKETYTNNVAGVHGLSGATAVTLSPDGNYVFVAGTTENGVAVFIRGGTDGTLTFAQDAVDGRTALGIAAPTGLISYVSNGQTYLLVASGASVNGVNGGLAGLDVATLSSVQPIDVRTTFSNVKSLTLNGGSSADVITVLAAPALTGTTPVPVTINTGGGNDAVNIADTGPAGTAMTANTGNGNDQITVSQAVTRPTSPTPATLTVKTGTGTNRVKIDQLAPSVAATVNPTAGGVTVVQVNGVGVPAASSVLVNGNLSAGSGSTFTGDALIDQAQGATYKTPTAATSGTIQLAGYGDVTFNNLSKTATSPYVQQVFLAAAPRPTISIPASIREGDSVTLTAGDASGQSNVTYAWDLGGTGTFTDATGPSVTLTWAQLTQLGINLGGPAGSPLMYPISVRATTTQNAVSFGGQLIQLSAGTSGVLKVLSTPPTLAAIPAAATLGTPFTLPLSATYLGAETPLQWTVNWGDGTTEQFGGDATSASHTYASIGGVTITVTDTDVNGTTVKSGTVTVTPSSQSVSVSSPSLSFPAGGALTATATTSGSPVGYVWTLTDMQGGTLGTVNTTTPTLTRTWAQLNALGVTDVGSFQVRVTATYQDAQSNTYTATSAAVTFTVTDTAPTATLVLSTPTVPQNSAAGSVTATVTGYSAPAASDTAASATVDYDFDNDGTLDLTGQAVGTAVNVPAGFLTTAGSQVVRAVVTDAHGSSTTVYATFTVTPAAGGSNPVVPPNPVLPTLTLDPVAAVDQGSPASLTIRSSGGNVPVSTYLVEWGDGSFDQVDAAGSSQTLTHVYAHAAPGGTVYTIGVVGFTAAGEDPAPSSPPLTTAATVNNVAPTVALTGSVASIVQYAAVPLTVTWAVTQPVADVVVQQVIDWGDGTSDTYTGDVTSATHMYATVPSGGTCTVRMTSLTNTDGAFANPSNALTIAVTDAVPVLLSSSLPAGVQDSPLNLSAVAASSATGPKPLTFTWSVTDPNGQATTVTHTGTVLPASAAQPGYQYVNNDGYSFTPVLGGTYTVTLTVRDDAGETTSVTNTVTVTHTAPTIPTFTVPATGTEGRPFAFGAQAAGAAADTFSYSWTVADSATAATVATATAAGGSFVPYGGTFVVALTVTDSEGGTVTKSASVSVDAVPPTITSYTVPAASTEGVTSTLSVTATPAHPSFTLSYQWRVTDPAGRATFLTGPSVAYTWAVPGTYGVQVTVTDPSSQQVVTSSTVSVANVAPTVTNVGSLLSPLVAVNAVSAAADLVTPSQVNLHATTADALGAAVTTTWTITPPSGSPITLTGKDVSFTPSVAGTYQVSVTATSVHGSATATSVLTLSPTTIRGLTGLGTVNPTLGAFPTAGFEGVPLAFGATAVDPGNSQSVLHYTWTITPPNNGSAITLVGAFPNFTPARAGNYAVQLTVTDYGGSTTVTAGTIAVANVPPAWLGVISLQPTTGLSEGQTAQLTAPAVSTVPANAATLQNQWTVTTPTGAVQTFSGSQISVPTGTSGTYSVSLVVVDREGGQSQPLTTTFAVAYVDPIITFVTIPPSGYVGFPVPLAAAATVPPADVANLLYTWTITDPTGATTLTGATPNVTPTLAGPYGVSLVVTDGTGGSASVSGSFNVLASPVAVNLFALPSTVPQGQTVGLQGAATDALGGTVTLTWTITPPTGPAFTRTGTAVSVLPSENGTYQVSLTAQSADGTATASGSFTVTNVPPTITAVVLPNSPMANTLLTLSATAADPGGDADPLTYTWTLLPPVGSPIVLTGSTVTFTPAFDGTYNVRLVVTDAAGAQDEANAVLVVQDAPLTAGALTPPVAVEGVAFSNVTVFHFTDADPNGVATNYTAVVTLGDGSQVTLTGTPGVNGQIVAAGDGFDVQLSYTYAAILTGVTFGVSVSDVGGSTTDAGTNDFSVGDAPMTPGTVVANGGVAYTTPTTLTAAFADANPAADPGRFSGTINWGDGTTTTFTSAAVSGSGGQYVVHGSHQYATYGSYAVTVTINDAGGSNATESGTAAVAAAPLTPGGVTAGGGVEYTTATALTAAFVDADPTADPGRFSGTINWGDGTTSSFTAAAVSGSGGQYTVSGSHQYALYGSYTVTVTINDVGGSSTTAIGTTTVAAAPLAPGSVAAGGGVEGTTPTTLTAAFADANPAADPGRFSGTINWGDGTTTTFTAAAVTGSGGNYAISGSHQYATYGSYAVTVTVNDAGGNSTTIAGTTTVANAPVSPGTTLADGGVEFTTAATLTASFATTDPTADPARFSGTINWGDGTTSSFTAAAVSGSGGQYTVSGSHQYALYGSYTVTVTINDVGGSSTTATGTTTVAAAPMYSGTVSTTGGIEGKTPTTLTAAFSDANATIDPARFSGAINWGDGTITPFTGAAVSGSGGQCVVHGSHQYALYGSYTVTVTINDVGGSSTTDTGTATVAPASVVVLPPVATTLQLVASAPAVSIGQPITFTATVTPIPGLGTPTGSVTFLDGGTPLATVPLVNGVAALTTPALSVGAHTITASYGGDAAYLPNVATVTETVSGVRPGQKEIIAVGTTLGGGPRIQVFDAVTHDLRLDFFAYDSTLRGGVAVATGDVLGTGREYVVTGAGFGGGPQVKIFDGRTGAEIASWFAYSPDFRGGVWVAVEDLDGDGQAEIVTGPGVGGGPAVEVWRLVDGVPTLVQSFMAFEPDFRGGVTVATGLTPDGRPTIVVGAGPGGGPRVRTYDAATLNVLSDVFVYEPSFTGGVYVASADVLGTGVGTQTLVGPGTGGGPRLVVLAPDGTILGNEFAAVSDSRNGLKVATLDQASGLAKVLIDAGQGVYAGTLSGGELADLEPIASFEAEFNGGVFVD